MPTQVANEDRSHEELRRAYENTGHEDRAAPGFVRGVPDFPLKFPLLSSLLSVWCGCDEEPRCGTAQSSPLQGWSWAGLTEGPLDTRWLLPEALACVWRVACVVLMSFWLPVWLNSLNPIRSSSLSVTPLGHDPGGMETQQSEHTIQTNIIIR